MCQDLHVYILLPLAYIQFENDGYVAKEEDTSKVVCMNSRGYNFSAEVTATYESNTTEGILVCIYFHFQCYILYSS